MTETSEHPKANLVPHSAHPDTHAIASALARQQEASLLFPLLKRCLWQVFKNSCMQKAYEDQYRSWLRTRIAVYACKSE
jgi:hypothetical protein